LRVFAKSDFKHDFGEGTPSRDKYTSADLQRFNEIAQGYGISQVKALTAGFNDVLGNNPYKLLKSSISQQIYPNSGTDADYMDEDEVLSKIGFDGRNIKALFKAEIAKAGNTINNVVLRIPDILLYTPGGSRTYEVSGVLIKDKQGEGILNIASRFELVTGGKSKFALIIDAATLATSEFVNSDRTPLPNRKCQFYIIENIENDSDSATKLTAAGLAKPKNADNLAKQPDLSFLRDIEKTVIYPKFRMDATEKDSEALFGNADLTLTRSGDDTEADFTFVDGRPYHVGSVSSNANVKNASLNVLASALSKGGKIVDKQLQYSSDDKTPFLFPYLKRVGDWCQALSLLDSSREYNEVPLSGVPSTTPITLGDIRKDMDAALGIVTVDRILLGYALSLGLDVFFTHATDLRLMVYYKNKETDFTPEQLALKIQEYKAEYETLAPQITQDNVAAILRHAIETVRAAKTDIDYIQTLRSVLYRVSMLRTTFKGLLEKALAMRTLITETTDQKQLYRLYFDITTIMRKIMDDLAHNETQKNSFATYPDFVTEKRVFDGFRGPRSPSRTVVADIQVIISQNMYDDVVQCNDIFHQYGGNIYYLFRPEPIDPAAFGKIYKAFDILGPVIYANATFPEAPITGGAKEDVTKLIDVLRVFQVTPLPEAEYNAVLNDPMKLQEYEELPLVLIQGSYYRDTEGIPYSVIDEYIITEKHLTTFKQLQPHLAELSPADLRFVTLRFLILYSDKLKGRYEKLVTNDAILPVLNEDGTPQLNPDGTPVVQENDVNLYEHKRLTKEVTDLRDIAADLNKDNNFISAFTKASALMINSTKWSPDTLELFAKDARNVVRNNDFYLLTNRLTTSYGVFKSLYSGSMNVESAANVRVAKRGLDNSQPGLTKRARGGRRTLRRHNN
jgi:hypothetical protein